MNIAIICGGPSMEHEVSLQSAVGIFNNIDQQKYNVKLIGMTKAGHFVSNTSLILNQTDPKHITLNPNAKKVVFGYQTIDGNPVKTVFPIIHGTFGEDGCLQGFLKTYGFNFVGEDVKTSALTMDKHLTKDVLVKNGVEVAPYIVLYKQNTQNTAASSLDNITAKLGTHLFVKPAALGSSVGISQCFNKQQLTASINTAFEYDNKIIIEKAIVGREIEIGMLDEGKNLKISVPAEIKSEDNFYSYDAKYINPEKSKIILPADMSNAEIKTLKSLATKIYKILDCRALARVDFFLTPRGFLFNEINTLPGFTKISMYPQMFIKTGISYRNLIDKLVQNSLKYRFL